jgi:hypothetical protein
VREWNTDGVGEAQPDRQSNVPLAALQAYDRFPVDACQFGEAFL